MDPGQVVARLLGFLQAGEVGVHHRPVALDGEDQGHVDRDALGEHRGDRRQACFGRRDLDQQVRAVDDLPQLDGLQDRLVGVVGQPRIDLDGHPAVHTVGQFVLLGQHVAGVADVVGGHGADGRVHVGAALGELLDLRVVGVPLGQGGLEDRRVGRHADDRLGVDQLLQVAGLQPLTGQVVEPHRYAGLGQCCQIRVLGHVVPQF